MEVTHELWMTLPKDAIGYFSPPPLPGFLSDVGSQIGKFLIFMKQAFREKKREGICY
jgi:hypothetical protein